MYWQSKVWSAVRVGVVVYILQGVSCVKVSISGFNSKADAESKKKSYAQGSNSQRFKSFVFFKYSK
jgi:hypothetical protein